MEKIKFKPYLLIISMIMVLFLCFNCNTPSSSSGGGGGGGKKDKGYKYAGGTTVNFGAIIDVNGDGIYNNGDYLASGSVTINGNQAVTFNYPADFTNCTQDSGYIQIVLSDGQTGGGGIANGKTFYCGTQDQRASNSTTINDDTIGLVFEDGGSTYYYYVGYSGTAGGIIDMDGNGRMSIGDYAYEELITINGNLSIPLTFPGDFNGVTEDSGTITIQVTNMGSYDGKMAGGGTSDYIANNSTTISGGTATFTLQRDGSDFYFSPDDYGIGCMIDVNSNDVIDAGDYKAGSSVTVDGNVTETYDYPGDFTLVTENAGTITVTVTGANSAHNGAQLLVGDTKELGGISTTIKSDSVKVVIEEM